MKSGDHSEDLAVESGGSTRRVSAAARRPGQRFLLVAIPVGVGAIVCVLLFYPGLLRPTGEAPLDESGWSDKAGAVSPSVGAPAEGASGPVAEMQALKQEALDVAHRVVSDLPDVPDAVCMMGLVHNRYGDLAQAETCWNRCLKLNPRYVMAYYCLGRSALERGRYEEAVEQLEKGIKIDPQTAESHLLLAKARMGLGRMDEAISALENYVQRAPRSEEGYFTLGQAYLHTKQYEKAKQCHTAAKEINPDWAGAYHALATVCTRLGQQEKAKEHREEFQRRRAEDPRVQGLRARGHNDLASLRQSVADAYVLAGQVYSSHGSPEKAEQHWLKATEVNPKDREAREALISMYEQKDRLEDAIRILGELAELEPENAIHYMNLGVLNARLKRFDAAEEAFKKLKEVAPERPQGYRALAELYLQTGQKIPEAKALARTAVQLHPVAANYYLLGVACVKDGDDEGALTAFELAVERDPGNVRYRQAYTEIQQKVREGSKDPTK